MAGPLMSHMHCQPAKLQLIIALSGGLPGWSLLMPLAGVGAAQSGMRRAPLAASHLQEAGKGVLVELVLKAASLLLQRGQGTCGEYMMRQGLGTTSGYSAECSLRPFEDVL